MEKKKKKKTSVSNPYGPRKNKVALEKAKQMYLEFKSTPQIVEATGLPRSTVMYHINGTWATERDLAKAQLFQALSDSKRVDFTRMTQAAITIMSKALQAMAARDEPPSLNEAQRAADVLNTLDRITRLDEGKATDIVSNQEKPMTIEAVKAKIKLDPFAITDAEYKEIEAPKETETKK